MSRSIILILVLALPLAAQDKPPVPKPPVPVPAPVNPAAPPVDPAAPPVDPAAPPVDPAANPVVPAIPPIPNLIPPRPVVNPNPNDPLPARAVAGVINTPDPNLPATLNAANLTGQDIAELYHQYTGLRVLVSQEAASGEVSFIVPGQMSYAQAARIIEKKLVMEGFEIVPDSDDPGLVKLVLANSQTSGVKALGAPILHTKEELETITPADRFVTYVMALQYLKPDDALRAFSSVVQQFGSAGTVAAVPNAGSVVISGNLPLVRMLVELKESIDVPSAQIGTKFVEVTFADVEDLAAKLNEIFNNQRQTQQSARVQRTSPTGVPPIPTNVAAGKNAAPGSGAAGEDTPLNIIAQPRTSRLFLMGRPVDIVFVEGLIAGFDAPSSKRNYLQLKLHYLPVIEFLDVAAQAIERTLETGVGSAGGGSRTSSVSQARNTATSNRSTARTSQTSRSSQTGGNTTGGGSRAQLQQQQINTKPEPLLINKTLLVADNISNSIVVNGPPHHIEIVEDLVNRLDQPSEQVAITAVFGTYDLSKNRTFGVDLAQMINGGRDFTAGVQNRGFIPGTTAVIDPNTIVNLGGLLNTAAGRGLNSYVAIGDSFGLFVNALETNTNFTAIARPTVFTTNNGEARLSSGRRIAIPTSTFQGGTTGNTTNIEFRDITLELVVTPLVNSKDEVTLDISLIRDGVGTDRVVGTLTVPDINTDELTTRVTVPNKSTVILGGLILEEDTQGGSGIPFLRSLPAIGPLFGSKNGNKTRSELVILIYPTILSHQSQVAEFQNTYDTKSKVAPRARASVEGSGVLPQRGAYTPDVGYPGNSGRNLNGAGRAVPVQPNATRGGVMTSPSHRAMRNKLR
jgi:general secretion pathway protein D